MGERVAHHLRLLVNFLRHEVTVIAFVDEKRRGGGSEYGTFDLAALGVADFDTLAGKHHRIALLEVGNRVGKGCQCDCIRAEIHFTVAIADGKRRAFAGAYDENVLPREQNRESEGPGQRRQRGRTGLGGERPFFISCVTRWATTSVSVSEPNFVPVLSSSSRSSRKFSMIPLWTTARRSVACGWALSSVGRPCVAQRVWPIPIVPVSGARASLASRLRSLPSARRRAS